MLCDLKIPATDGLGVLRHVRSVSPQTLFILMTGYASVDSAIEAFRGGAHDYILKPVVLEDVLQKVKRLLEAKSLAWEVELLRRQVNYNSESTGLIGESRAIRDILAMIAKIAPTGSNVLITGESGVGKEVVARAIHLQSPRKDKVFCRSIAARSGNPARKPALRLRQRRFYRRGELSGRPFPARSGWHDLSR